MAHPSWLAPIDAIRFHIAARTNPSPVRDAAFSVIDALQRFPAAVQVDAAFVAAAIMARSLNQDGHELLHRARRMAPDVEAHDANASAISDYARGELR